MAWRRSRLTLVWALAVACQFPDYAVVPPPASMNAAGATGAAGAAGAGEPPPNPCLQSPCLHDGRCIPVDDSFVCLCADGFRGDTCEINFDNCDPDPCQNGGSCVDGVGTSHCDCPAGWDGATCEHDVDDCATSPCQNAGVCVDGFMSYTCECQPGYLGQNCGLSLSPTCKAIHDDDPTKPSGVYEVDPDGPGRGRPPLDVLCDMTAMDGGWTMVGQEREGDAGTFKFLGISVGDPSAAASQGASALVGEQFQGLYDEMRIGWASAQNGNGAIYFRVTEEVFANNVRKSMPLTGLVTTDATLQGWVNDAGGAVFCRGSESPGVRPGDSSWAIKPKDVILGNCGCNSMGWAGKGAFYGGHTDPTLCNPSGGGWAGVADEGQPKGNITKWGLQLWIR